LDNLKNIENKNNAEALLELDRNYDSYKIAVEGFKKNLNWAKVARDHIELYDDIISSIKAPASSSKATITITRNQTGPMPAQS
jgi:hypothetical protein